jgi:hypothetical protein
VRPPYITCSHKDMRSGAYASSRQDTDYTGAGWSGVSTPGLLLEVRPA